MFRHTIFKKIMLVMIPLIVIYVLAIMFTILPKVNKTIISLEEEKAKESLSKVVVLSKNVAKDLSSFKKYAYETHKKNLKNLTDVEWSIIKTKYIESNPKNISNILKKKAEVFERKLIKFYNDNKNKYPKSLLKEKVKDFIRMYRYENNGYFFAGDLDSNSVVNPSKPSIEGKSFKNIKDKNGIYFVNEMAKVAKEKGRGVVKYYWLNPTTKKIEEKISYIFLFKPFKWFIGTGEYYSELNKRLKNEAIELIRKLRYANNNYFFIINYKNILISHPYLQGKDMSNIKDTKGHLIVPSMVKIARKYGEGFYSYWWKKNKKDNTPYEKLSFVKDFPDWKIVIGTGVYMDDIDKEMINRKKELIKELRGILKDTKIGKTGYLYIFNSKGKMLIHPNKNLDGKNIKNLINPGKNSMIFDDLVKAAKTTHILYYKWDKPNDPKHYIYDKVSWIKYIPELDWYVCSSAYLDEFKDAANNIKEHIVLVSLGLLILSMIISGFLFKQILKPLSLLSNTAKNIANGDYSKRVDIVTNDEIGSLAKDFNKMIDNIEGFIKNLDNKVQERTKELEHQKKYIQAIMDSQYNIVITTDGKKIRSTNKAFLDFFNVKNIDEFRDKFGACICDTFEEKEGYLSKEINGERWIYYILNRPNKVHKAIIKREGIEHIFALSAHKFEFDNEKLITTVFINITETEKIKEQLEHQKKYIQAIMDSQDNIVITTDGKRIRSTNKAFLDFYNVKNVDDFVRRYGTCICDTFEEKEGFLTKEVDGERWLSYILNRSNEVHKAIIKKEGVEHIFALSAHKFEFDNETLMTTVFVDITDIEKIKEELEIAKNKAEESVKTKSEFLANMSHEIRTPMNGIIGMAHLALQTNLNDKQRNFIQKIDSSAKALLGILNDILDFSKIEAGKLKIEKVNFDLFKVIDNVVTIISPKVKEKGLDLIVDYDPKLGKEFYGDPLRVGQILTNLTGNAVKFTKRGEITIVIKKVENDRVRFEVKDTGIGIPKDKVAKLFKSFSQADGSTTRKYGGTGLGLAISKQLTELMNGKIWVESIEGIGSNFIFEIELQKIKADEKNWTILSGKKALVVDDSSSWQSVMSYMLESFGLKVDSVNSAKEAIKKVSDDENHYDIILLDWYMPQMDGIECAKEILKIKDIDIILVSAYQESEIEKEAKESGIKYFLEKPINPSLLNNMLSDIFLGTNKAKQIDTFSSKEEELKQNTMTLKGSHILLVEDNQTNQEIILGLLENSGIKISIANDGEEAVDKFKELKDLELILMDIQMPKMDGYEATKIIRNIDKDIPIIALTANAMKEDVQRTKKAGMNEHLNKPIEVSKLYKILLKYISKKSDDISIALIEETKQTSSLPDFKYIDKEKGLKLIMGNEKIYKNILKGLYEFKDINLNAIADKDEFKRVTHTIKGLSASAGATKLHKIAKELDESGDKTLIPKFYAEFNKVMDELKNSNLFKEDTVEKKEISQEKKEKLFDKLKDTLSSKRVKNIKAIVNELSNYKLSKEDEEIFQKIKEFTKKFKFKEALEVLNG